MRYYPALKIGPYILKDDLLVLEYSRSQKAFHVHPLIEAVQENLLSFIIRKPTDYFIISLFTDYNELVEFQERLIKELNRPELSSMSVDDIIRTSGP